MSVFVPLLLALLSAPPTSSAPAAEKAAASTYQLVLLDGRRLPLIEAPRWAFGRSTVTVAGGKRLNLQWSQVDQEATRRANPLAATSTKPRVWTAADLARIDNAGLTITGAASPDQGQTRPSGNEDILLASRPKDGEADWRARATPLRQEIAQLEAQLKALERSQKSWESFALGTTGYNDVSAKKLGDIRRAREAAESRLQGVRGSWAQLEEEARKTNTPPGWLR